MSRAAPPPEPTPSPEEQMHLERRAALLTWRPGLVRLWAAKWGVPIIEDTRLSLPERDRRLLESIHGAILRDDAMPAPARIASAGVLAGQGDPVAAEVLRILTKGKGDGTTLDA